MRVLWTSVTTFLILFIAPSTAEIKSIIIQSDKRSTILLEKFPFTHTGIITVSISKVSVTSSLSQPDPSRQGFFLLTEESLVGFMFELKQNSSFCVLDSKHVVLFFTLRDSALHGSHFVTEPGNYSLFFANCNPESLITMDVHTKMINHDVATNNYLSTELKQLPSLYFIFSLLYLCFLGFWILECIRNQGSVHQLHLLMGAFLFMKSLSLLCAAEDKHYVKVTGNSHGWNVLFYIFQFINSMLSFTVILLVGFGWPYLKPFLLEKEKNLLMIVIPLQVLANVASIVIDATGPSFVDWVMWNQVFLLADFICCCAVIFPVVWSVSSFSTTDGKGARNLCVAVVGYLLFTRFGDFALKIIGEVYKDPSVCSTAEEIAKIVFYLVMFYMFLPVEDCFVLGNLDDSEEAGYEMIHG